MTKKKFIPVVIIVAALAGYGVYAQQSNTWPFQPEEKTIELKTTSDKKDNPKDQSQSEANENTKENTPHNNSSNESPDHTPKQYTPSKDDSEPSKNQLTGVINYKAVKDGSLVIRNTIDQQLASGTCRLVLTNKATGKTVKKTANMITNPSSSTCQGFSVPTSSLGSGNWTIKINLTSGSKTGQITGDIHV